MRRAVRGTACRSGRHHQRSRETKTRGPLDGSLVVDLSALWSGPLCAHLLTLAGARVVKVESASRLDGARRGPPAFFDLLHAGQESVVLDLPTERDRLRHLIEAADVVIEASRPRAMEQLGIDAGAIAAGGTIWVSITGYGRASGVRHRVAFGDDAAVAGGLVATADGEPAFCADAVADPLAGLTAAAAVLDRWGRAGGCLIDVAMSNVAAWCARWPPSDRATPADVASPQARRASGHAAPAGRDTTRVLRELGV